MKKNIHRPFRRIVSLCAALLLPFAASFAGAEDAADPVVVRVGGFTYSLSTVQHSLDSLLDLSAMLRGDAPTVDNGSSPTPVPPAPVPPVTGDSALPWLNWLLAGAGLLLLGAVWILTRHRKEGN